MCKNAQGVIVTLLHISTPVDVFQKKCERFQNEIRRPMLQPLAVFGLPFPGYHHPRHLEAGMPRVLLSLFLVRRTNSRFGGRYRFACLYLTLDEYTRAVERHVADPDDRYRIGRSQGRVKLCRQMGEVRVPVVPGKQRTVVYWLTYNYLCHSPICTQTKYDINNVQISRGFPLHSIGRCCRAGIFGLDTHAKDDSSS